MEPLEDKIQSIVASFDQGIGQVLIKGFIYLCIFAGIFGIYAWSQFTGLKDPAAMEYSQLARNIAHGRGFSTQCIRPADAWYLDSNSKKYDPLHFPDIRNAPAYPAVLGGLLAVVRPSTSIAPKQLFGPEKKVVVPLGIFFSLVTGVFVYLLAQRLFTARIAIVAVLLYFLGGSVMTDSISGTPLPMLTMLATAVAYTAVAAVQNRMTGGSMAQWFGWLSACAALSGAAFLTGYSAFVLVPVVVVFIGASLDSERWPAILVFLMVFMLVAVPWTIRNKVVSGGFFGTAPYSMLNGTFLYEGDSFDRSLQPEIHNVKIARALKAKITDNLLKIYDNNLRTLGSGFVICFFLVSFFFKFDRPEADVFRWATLVGLVLAMLALALCGGESERLLNIFLPVVIIYGCALLFLLVEKFEFVETGWETFLAAVLVALTAIPMLVRIFLSYPAGTYPPYYQPFIGYVSSAVAQKDVLCTDVPWATAWYGNRASVLLPQTVEDFKTMNETKIKVAGIYLTTETGNKPYVDALVDGPWSSWLPVLNRKAPADFPFKHATALPPGSHDQLFLSDPSKWRHSDDKPAQTNAATGAIISPTNSAASGPTAER